MLLLKMQPLQIKLSTHKQQRYLFYIFCSKYGFAAYQSMLRFMKEFFLETCPAEPRYPAFTNSVDPDQQASEEATDLDLHCLPFSV